MGDERLPKRGIVEEFIVDKGYSGGQEIMDEASQITHGSGQANKSEIIPLLQHL